MYDKLNSDGHAVSIQLQELMQLHETADIVKCKLYKTEVK